MPILGKDACIGMQLIKILDCDTIHMVAENATSEVSIEAKEALNDYVLKHYDDVFDSLGQIPGEYETQTNPDVPPSVQPPCKIPIALQQTVKTELESMVHDKVIAPVTEHTKWVSSMVVVQKKSKTVLVCLDPRNLNQAIMHSHYPLPTIKEVATRLTNAKLFTVLDAKSGFCQVKLDELSSYLTTFNTLFGWYRWKRMHFGISSAPEVWQQSMHQLIEGLIGIEIIADDFLMCGFGESTEQALASHDKNLQFLRVC